MSTALILGAGFSREISKHMPLTDELGNLVIERLKPDGLNPPSRPFEGGYFEAWLSRLAEDQPDLDDARNLMNRSWFLRISEAVHSLMIEREASVLNQQPPWWLQKLLGIAHAHRMTMITFNYDTLIENTVNSHFLYDWISDDWALPSHVIDDIPPLPPGPARLGAGEVNTFRLIKLHGSVDTYWVPGDESGATINRMLLSGCWGRPEPVDDTRRRRELPGRSAFIVPPASAKSAFYRNPVTREFWRTAGEAIGKSRRVALLGYSMPNTDLVASGMLADQLADHPVDLNIANRHPEPVARRLMELGVDPTGIDVHGGGSSIPDFVDYLETETCRPTTNLLLGETNELPLVVAVSERHAAVPTEIRLEDNQQEYGIELVVEPLTTLKGALDPVRAALRPVQAQAGIRSRRDLVPRFVRLADLQPLIRSGHNLMTVLFPNGERARIIDSTKWNRGVNSSEEWLVLIPSAAPRSPF